MVTYYTDVYLLTKLHYFILKNSRHSMSPNPAIKPDVLQHLPLI